MAAIILHFAIPNWTAGSTTSFRLQLVCSTVLVMTISARWIRSQAAISRFSRPALMLPRTRSASTSGAEHPPTASVLATCVFQMELLTQWTVRGSPMLHRESVSVLAADRDLQAPHAAWRLG